LACAAERTLIEPGAPAPDFTLRDQDLQKVSLGDFAGRRVMLCFYPGDFSPGCSDQLSLYQEVLEEIRSRGAELVGISVDSPFAHRAFRETLGLEMPLLSDFHPKGEVSSAYGAYQEDRGFSDRSLVLVGPDGTVEWSYASPSDREIPGANLIFDALDR
jgi:peroxiredoxin